MTHAFTLVLALAAILAHLLLVRHHAPHALKDLDRGLATLGQSSPIKAGVRLLLRFGLIVGRWGHMSLRVLLCLVLVSPIAEYLQKIAETLGVHAHALA